MFNCGRCPYLQVTTTEKQRYGILYLLLPVRSVPLDTQKTTLNLPEALHAEAKAEAARLRISLTQLVVQALTRELKRLNGKETVIRN